VCLVKVYLGSATCSIGQDTAVASMTESSDERFPDEEGTETSEP